MDNNVDYIQIDEFINTKVKNKIENLINSDNKDKVKHEQLALTSFSIYLKDIMPNLEFDEKSIPFSGENEVEGRRELFEFNYIKAKDLYINVVPVFEFVSENFLVPKNIFDSIHHPDLFSFVFINPSKTNAYFLGSLTYEELVEQKVFHDNHFYKMSFKNLKDKAFLLEYLNKSEKYENLIEVTEDEKKEKQALEKTLKEQIKKLHLLDDKDFIEEKSYLPLSWIKLLFRFDSLAKLYLEAQAIFKDNLAMQKLTQAYTLVNKAYAHYKDNKENISELGSNLTKLFDGFNDFNKLLKDEIPNFESIFSDIQTAYKDFTKVVNDPINLIKTLQNSISDLNFADEDKITILKTIFTSLENSISITGKIFDKDIKLNISDKVEINNFDLSSYCEDFIKALELNTILSLIPLGKDDYIKNLTNSNQFDIIKDILENNDENKDIKLKSIFIYFIKLLIKLGYLKPLASLTNIQLTILIDLSIFIFKCLSNKDITSVSEFSKQLLSRNLASIFILLKKLEPEIAKKVILDISLLFGSLFGFNGITLGLVIGNIIGEKIKSYINESNFEQLEILLEDSLYRNKNTEESYNKKIEEN